MRVISTRQKPPPRSRYQTRSPFLSSLLAGCLDAVPSCAGPESLSARMPTGANVWGPGAHLVFCTPLQRQLPQPFLGADCSECRCAQLSLLLLAQLALGHLSGRKTSRRSRVKLIWRVYFWALAN